MPVYLDRSTNRLYIEFQFKGTRYKERLPAGTKRKDAEELEIKIKNDMLMQSHGIETKRKQITFEQFLKEYYGPHAIANYSPASYQRALYVCKDALKFFRGKPMRSIKAADIEQFKNYRTNCKTLHDTPRKPATVLRELSILSKIFSIAVENDLCEYNPCGRVEKPQFDNIQDKILRREDEDKLLANMFSEWAKDICKMVLNTGLRQNDLMQLKRFEVDRAAMLIRKIQGKTRRRVVIPLNAEALSIIEKHWHNGNDVLFPSPKTGKVNGSVRHAIQRACVRAGIPLLSIRDFRRTYGTRLQENGTDTATVARMLGHADLRSIHRYERSIETMRKAADSLISSPIITPARLKRIK